MSSKLDVPYEYPAPNDGAVAGSEEYGMDAVLEHAVRCLARDSKPALLELGYN